MIGETEGVRLELSQRMLHFNDTILSYAEAICRSVLFAGGMVFVQQLPGAVYGQDQHQQKRHGPEIDQVIVDIHRMKASQFLPQPKYRLSLLTEVLLLASTGSAGKLL